MEDIKISSVSTYSSMFTYKRHNFTEANPVYDMSNIYKQPSFVRFFIQYEGEIHCYFPLRFLSLWEIPEPKTGYHDSDLAVNPYGFRGL